MCQHQTVNISNFNSMIKLLIFKIILLLVSCIALDNDYMYYETAFNYLKKLPEIRNDGLKVSDSIVHIDISNFYEELSKDNSEVMLFKLDSLDRKRNTEKYILSDLHKLPSDSSSDYTLFFSEIIENKLLAEIVKDKGLKNASYKQLTAFSKSKIFLFVFDEKKISEVYSKEIQYD